MHKTHYTTDMYGQAYKLRLAFKIMALLLEKFRGQFSGAMALLWQRCTKDLELKFREIANVHRTVRACLTNQGPIPLALLTLT